MRTKWTPYYLILLTSAQGGKKGANKFVWIWFMMFGSTTRENMLRMTQTDEEVIVIVELAVEK